MRSFLLVFLCILSSLFSHSSTSLELASLQGEPSALVYGCVNAITGDLLFEQYDTIVKGAEPIYLPRRYISREAENPALRWQVLSHAMAIVELDVSVRVYVPEPTGISLLYLPEAGAIDGKRHTLLLPLTLHPHPEQFRAGLVHHQGSYYHPLANKVVLDTTTLKVIHADGSYRLYKYLNKKTRAEDELAVSTKTTSKMLLDHEKLANGHFIDYVWEIKDKLPTLTSITTRSPKNTSLATVHIQKKGKEIQVTTSDSHLLKYTYDFVKKTPLLVSAVTSEYPEEKNLYNKHHRLKEKTFPDGRNLQIKYDKKGRVTTLIGPHGPLCTFAYSDGMTQVIDLQGNKTLYHFDSERLRLSKIETYQGETLLKTELFSWDSLGNLLSKQISSDLPAVTFRYTYDEQGKVKTKTQIGSISSEGAEESYTISYTYNDQNLLLEEKEENGLATYYTYLPSTSLPTSKIVKKNERILKRTFYTYNEDNFLISETLDNGPEYSERHIQRITPKKGNPYFGLPEVIEEFYQENGSEVFLKKTHFTYDSKGNITAKSIYDQEQIFRYKEQIEYNDKGQIQKEIDPEGYVTTYAYDRNGNKVAETSPLGLKTIYTYDTLNRCTSKRQENYLTTFASFTLQGKPTRIVDPLKGTTKHTYDALGNLTTSTDALGFTTIYSYTPLGKQKSVTNPLGHTTHTSYNIYGSPLTISYPDGTQERFTYTLDGQKQSHTDQNNTVTFYTHDDYGNVTKEEIHSNGLLVSQIQRTYNAFHLLEAIDPEGVKTTYEYDGAGRLEKKTKDTLITTYSYDPLSRCTHETSLDYTLEKAYDNLNRVILEKEYAGHKLLSQIERKFDAASNPTAQITYPNHQKAVTTYQYDTFGREIEKKDPLGHQTLTTYLLHPHKLEKKTLFPGNIETIEIFNPLNQKIETEKKQASQTIAKTTATYDSCGNLSLHITILYRGEEPLSTHTVAYTYDSMQRKTSVCEEGAKTTHYTYTPKGQLSSLTKPNGTLLFYTHNPLGFLTNLRSSDQTIHYTYVHNTRGELLYCHDHVHHTDTHYQLDPFGNILQEHLANGYILKSSYDPLSRRTSLQLPNQKEIQYRYEGFALQSVHIGPYTHSYTYDLAGNIIQENTIHQASLQRGHDLLNRPTFLHAPGLTQECSYDDRGNIVEMAYRQRTYAYTYDPHDHLTSEPEHCYEYDSLHNRISKDHLSYTVNNLNQIEQAGQETYVYDPNGNLISHGNTTFEYDALDRLTKVITPDHTSLYTYDCQHRRLTQNTTSYIWDGDHELGTPNCYRVLGPTHNAEIGSSIALFLNDLPHIPLHDLQGNLIEVTDLSKQLLESRTFTAFGECPGPFYTPWGFSSKRHDPETQFVYFGRRFYDPSLGRFITADPEGYTDSWNLYAYCLNNPLTHLDPYGLLMILTPNGQYPSCSLEDMRQLGIGAAHGVAQWTVDTTLALARYGGGVHGMSDMSFLETYELHTQAGQHFRQSSERWLQTTLGADLQNPFYHYAYRASYTATDLASAVVFPPFAAAGKAVSASRAIANPRTATKIANVYRLIFQPNKAKSLAQVSMRTKTAERTFRLESVAGLGTSAKMTEVVQLEKRISNWLGEGAKLIRNEAGDPVFLSQDGLRCVRFDFNYPHPHHNLHAHVEVKVNGKWVKSGQIYPTDVPHN